MVFIDEAHYGEVARDILIEMIFQETEGSSGVKREDIFPETSLAELDINPRDLIIEAEEILGLDLEIPADNLPQTVEDFEKILSQHCFTPKEEAS